MNFPIYHYFRNLRSLVCVVFYVRLSICVLFHETLCFYHTISYYSSIQLLSCKCVFIKLLCSSSQLYTSNKQDLSYSRTSCKARGNGHKVNKAPIVSLFITTH